MALERKSLNDILNETPQLRERGNWVCLNIETAASWPTRPQSFEFEDQTIWVMPYTTDNYPGLAINCPGDLDQDDANALLHRALSLLVWLQDRGALVATVSGGNLPRMMGIGMNVVPILCDGLDLTDLPRVPTQKASVALALMREARGLNSPAYAFLSFYKVLELTIPDGRRRGRWVTENIGRSEGILAKEALKKLRASVQGDIGEHLLESGRQAIAHAKFDPHINPDNPRDARRLSSELPIMEGMAVLAIEQHLGIQTRRTAWREHLYELRGWKGIFGDYIIATVSANESAQVEQPIEAPIINVRLRRSAPFSPLEGMRPVRSGLRGGNIEVVYESEDRRVRLMFWLNLADERLVFDIQRSIATNDDGSAVAARNIKELERFFRDYFANGELQMWNAETGALLSRCDAFLPHNVVPDFKAADAAIAAWDAVIVERELAESQQTDKSTRDVGDDK